MKTAGKILRVIYSVYFYTAFAVALALCYPFFYFLLKNPKYYPIAHSIRKWGCRIVLLVTGMWYKKIQLAELDKDQTYIFCSNHSSFLDIIIPIAAFDRYHHYLGKKELGDIPLFGIFFRYMDIPVDRTNKSGLFNAYIRAEKDLEKNISLVIFPEGTTSLKAPKMVPFKQGAFKLSARMQVPIVPITFADNWKLLHYDKRWSGRPGISKMVIHPPIMPLPFTDENVKLLKELTYDTIDQTLKSYNN